MENRSHWGRSDEARAAWYEREKRVAGAREIAPTLVGLSIEDAQRAVDAVPGIHIRFVAGPHTADFGYGRVAAVVQDGVVVEAAVG